MTLFLDTSALVKLYVNEFNRDVVVTAVLASDQIVLSVIAYPEARAALARRMREATLHRTDHDQIVRQLDRDWQGYYRVRVTHGIAEHAGQLAEQLSLRGFDAVHLASAVRLQARFGAEFRFLTFDVRLMEAARQVVPVYEWEE